MARLVTRRFAVFALLVLQLILSRQCLADSEEEYPFDHEKRKMGASLLESLGWDPRLFFTQPEMIKACQAVREKSLPQLEELQRAGIDWNLKGKDGVTVLLWALLGDDLPIFKQLLAWGADPNVAIHSKATILLSPLDYSIIDGETVFFLCIRMQRKSEWAAAALVAGGDVNFIQKETKSSVIGTMLQNPRIDRTIDMDVFRETIQRGANLNYGDSVGRTPLMIAIVADQFEAAVHLVDCGASLDCYDNRNWQAIHHLASFFAQNEEFLSDNPDARKEWDESPEKKSFDQLVTLFRERGHSLVEARVDYERRFQLVDGLDYMIWRRRMRTEKDPCMPKSVKPSSPSADTPAGEAAKKDASR
jgi:ankyrin repeat protein